MSVAEITQQHQKTSSTTNVSPGKQNRKLRMPLIAAGVSLIVILIFIKIFFFPDAESTNQERLPIAVADFINQTNEPELDGLSGMLITALEQSRKLAVVTRSRMFDILGQMGKKDVDKIDESLGQQICKQANIDAMVVASIRKFGKLYTIDLKVVDPNKDEYLFTAKEEAEGQESIPSMLDKLSEKTRVGLNERIAQIKESNQNIASVTTSNLEAYQHFFRGEQFIDQLKFNEAIEEFKKAVVIDSTFAQAYYRLAYAESWEDESEVIQKSHLERALKHINRMPERERYLVRSTNAIINNDFKAGVAILKEMEQIYPDDKEMIYNIGDWSWHLNDYTTAAAYLEKTLQIDPNHQRALQHLSWTYRDMGNYDKMLETAKRYVAVSGSGESYQLLSNVYTRLGQLEQGISTLKQARDLLPNNYEITGSIADLYTYLGLFAKAEEELKTLVENNQTPNAKLYGYEELADFYPFQGKYRRALHFADKAIELSWQNKDTTRASISHIRKGFLLFFGWNDLDGAWKEAEKTFPFNDKITFLPYWGALYTMQAYHGDYAEALSVAKTIPIKWAYLLAESIIYSLEQDEKNAEIFADSTFQTCSDFAKISILYLLAECQFEKGLFDKALESLRKLQPINSNFYYWRSAYYPKSFYLMGKIYEKKGDTTLAIRNYEKFLELWKDADKDLPDLIDAKTRYAKLKALVSK
jgi:tetratricopeptide (TPR) repeat protein